LGVGREAKNSTPEKCTVTKPPEPMEEDHEGGQDPHRVAAPVKKKKPHFNPKNDLTELDILC
jgi:hypothetical protein